MTTDGGAFGAITVMALSGDPAGPACTPPPQPHHPRSRRQL